MIDPQDSNTLYVAGTTDSRAGTPYVYRGTRDGFWKPIVSLSRYCCFLGYGLAWSTQSHILYAGATNGKLYGSSNSKEPDVSKVSWQQVSDFGSPQTTVISLAHSEPNETLYVTLVNRQTDQAKLLKSPDGGQTWQELTVP